VVFAPPSLIDTTVEAVAATPNAQQEPASQTQGWGRKVKPPSMVLDEDVNGFKKSQPQRKNKKGKNKKVSKLIELFPLSDVSSFRTRTRMLSLRGIRWRFTTLFDQMTTMSINFGVQKTELNAVSAYSRSVAKKIEKGRGEVLVILTQKLPTLRPMRGQGKPVILPITELISGSLPDSSRQIREF
jgi:hypothetical protein